MKTPVKIILLVAACMVAVGAVLSAIALSIGAKTTLYWNKGFNVKNEHKVTVNEELAEFNEININISATEITVKTGNSYRIEGQHYGDVEYKVENGVLTATGNGYNEEISIYNFDFSVFKRDNIYPSLTVYVPQEADIQKLKISCNAADVTLAEITADTLEMSIDAGDIDFTGVEFQNSKIDLNAGDLHFENSVLNNLDIDCDMGNLDAFNVSVNNADITLNAGDLDIEGDIRGEISVDCDAGDINININGAESDYSYRMSLSFGELSVNGRSYGRRAEYTGENAENSITIDSEIGNVDLNFKK